MKTPNTIALILAGLLLAAACGGGATDGASATAGTGGAAANSEKSAFTTPTPGATTAATAASSPKASGTPTAPAKAAVPSKIESKGFVSTCNQNGQRWYAAYAKVPDGAFVSGGGLEVLLQTANGTELQRRAVQLSPTGQGPTQGYLVSQAWQAAQIGGELAQVKLGVTQEPTDAQLPDLAKLNPFEFRIVDIVFTTTGPQVAITTENKGEVNASYQATGFIVNGAGELVAAVQGSGQAVAKSPLKTDRMATQFTCSSVAAPVTAYVQVVITQQAGGQNGQRTEVAAFTKAQ